MLTIDELERAAYINGYTEVVKLIARMEDEVSDALILTHQEELEHEREAGYRDGYRDGIQAD